MIIAVFPLITTWYETSKDHRDLLIYKSHPEYAMMPSDVYMQQISI
jgi:hypothetical protein